MNNVNRLVQDCDFWFSGGGCHIQYSGWSEVLRAVTTVTAVQNHFVDIPTMELP